jgi:GNAT superfamily N-acetyltransferase
VCGPGCWGGWDEAVIHPLAKTAVRLDEPHISHASVVLARAFHDYPMFTLIFPDADERTRSLPHLWDAAIRYSLNYGEVYTTADVRAVACWLAPGNEKMTFWRLLGTGFGLPQAILHFSGDARDRTLEIVHYMDMVHEREVSRAGLVRPWYLWLLGVDPAFQGQGLAHQLIQPILARADGEGIPCYLETAAEANVVFYEKLGFEVVSDDVVPDHGLRFWSMLRKAA